MREALIKDSCKHDTHFINSLFDSYIFKSKPHLCPWYDGEQVKRRGSLGPVGIHGNRWDSLLGDRQRGNNRGAGLGGLSVAAVTVRSVDQVQMQHLSLELTNRSELRPPGHAIGPSSHVTLP